MNHSQFTKQWESVARAELARRKYVLEKYGATTYLELFSKNIMCHRECEGHVWVPATHLWIHDGGKTKKVHYYYSQKISYRAFNEAMPRVVDDQMILPLLCFNCGEMTERTTEKKTKEQRVTELLRQEKEREKRRKGKRGRKGRQPTISSLEELGL